MGNFSKRISVLLSARALRKILLLMFLTVSSVSSDSIVKGIIDDIIKMAVKTVELPPTFENDGYLHISFALLYSLLQKRLLTFTLVKSCLTEMLFNKRRMQVKCISHPERTNDHGQATGKLYHLQLRVECTFFFYLQSQVRTHAVLVIGLYELLVKL
jgi:hypothetical protein